MIVGSTPPERAHTSWLIPAPAGDETLRSVLQRAADFYELRPDALWQSLAEGVDVSGEDIDWPPDAIIARLAETLEVTPSRVQRLTLDEGEGWLASGARHAYCPSCWREDDGMGRPRHFRRAWAKVLALHCARHSKPLMLWHPARGHHAPRAGDDITLAEFLADAVDTQPDVRVALNAIHEVAVRLDRCLYYGAPWPTSWKASPAEARQMLVHVMTPDGPAESTLLSQAYTNAALRPFVHSGPNVPEAGMTQGWERLRRTRDPATRRMALWLVGSWLVPTWPSSFLTPLPPL